MSTCKHDASECTALFALLSSINILVIENGKAYVNQASCPDGICSSHRPIGNDGESIICLPNKVVVEIRTSDKNRPDVIA